ncbi:ABC transporter substrate-binding protein [Bacillus sp. EB106-08-02-XG196]|jgi:putative aldouronate transport system substrate-binding protein|uniref:ABC transporter substrate-binding protein n=1 Tax=Bacillus sp. EB106-08-02-XG196 TaxID=2737049 RepID=UPI0015C4C0DB|nr:ABC transporter substrate-binding protein [Bacillus sp. EB106-08-02-XG196]NWQ40313.1 ABC transporter substrate-binding protein [Bacillus sp. EB106-08-02-XG196]
MRKRILSLLFAVIFMMVLVGCSEDKETNTTAKGDGINFDEEPFTLTVAYAVNGDTPGDLAKVQEKVNEITLKKINAKVEFKPVAVSAMANTYTLAASSGEKLDLIMMLPGSRYITQYASTNMIRPLDDIVDQYGKDIKTSLGDILEVTKVNGKLYGIPGKRSYVQAKGFWLHDGLVKKHNIDVSQIKSVNDLDPILEKIHASEPDVQTFFPTGVSHYLLNFDNLGDGFGVLRDAGTKDLEVVNMLETEEYINTVKKVREWYQKGYISKDFATTQTTPTEMMDANKLFAAPNSTDFANAQLGNKVPKQYATIHAPVDITTNRQTYIWSVPAMAKRPEKSIQFLNLTFEDRELATLLKFGIEGEHFTKNSDGSIDTSKGNSKTFLQYWPIWGDGEKYPIEMRELVGLGGDLEKYNSAFEEWKKNTKTSKAFGFMFDPQPVKTELASCTAVMEQYQKLLEGGALDPDKYLKTINDELYAAGLQKIIDEKQKQLDAWAKTQK